MSGAIVKGGGSAVMARERGGALKKFAGKKAPGKKAAKKAPAKKTPGKKAAKHAEHVAGGRKQKGYHHLQRAAAVISLLEGESGGDLRMLLEEGVSRFRNGAASAAGLLRAAEHLAMAGLYAARASHRLDVEPPEGDGVGKLLDRVSVRVDRLAETRLGATAGELLRRAESLEDDVHLAWELGKAADGICDAVEAE